MYRVWMLLFVILIGTLLASAQAGDPGKNTVAAEPNGPNTLDGCLQREGFQYSLIDQAGKKHRLTGDTGKLGHLTGHQVEVTGQPAVKTIDTTEQFAASTVEEIPVFQVKTSKLISKTCTSPATTSKQ
jgi:hypothetical protein